MSRKSCGTDAGYHLHFYYKETPCEDCKIAHREYDRQYRKANRDQINRNVRARRLFAKSLERRSFLDARLSLRERELLKQEEEDTP